MPVSVKTRQSVPTALILLAVFAGIFVLSWLTPLIADDYNYAFSWATNARIENLRDVAASMDCHRTYTNGRVFAHGFVHIFSYLPHWLFALCNAAVAAGQAFLLHLYLRRGGAPRPLLLLCTVFLLWICMPVYGQIFLWTDGACNYSWGLFLSLAVLYPFYAAQTEDALSWPLAGKLLYIPLAFVAGTWSEHISFSLLAACFFTLLLIWVRKRRFPAYLFALLLSGGLGYLYLMLAPSMLGGPGNGRGELSLAALTGALQRLLAALPGGAASVFAALGLGLVLLLLCRVGRGRGAALRLLFVLASAVCLLGCVFFALRTGEGLYGLASSSQLSLMLAFSCFFVPFTAALFRAVEPKKLAFPFLLFLGGICSLPLFLFASYFPARGCAAAVLFSVLSGALVLRELGQGRGMRLAAAATVLAFALFFSLGTADILAVHRSELERQSLIRQAQQGDGIVMAPAHPVRSKYSAQYGLNDLNAEGSWPDDIIARYYGLRQITLAADDSQP